jgi:transcription initiation factor TFIIIB Brf1 subunit/transcription initiation factor TFIIB
MTLKDNVSARVHDMVASKKHLATNSKLIGKSKGGPSLDFEDATCCESPDIFVTVEGNVVCRRCGMCFGSQLVESERRAYTVDELKNRKRTEPVWRSFGPRTVMSGIKTDSKGNQLPPNKQALFARLSKIQGSLISSIERNYWEAKPKLQAFAHKLGVPDHIIETAWKIYSEVAKQKLTMGRSIQAFTAASQLPRGRCTNPWA